MAEIVYSVDSFEKQLAKDKFKFIRLDDDKGQTVIKYNHNKIPAVDRWEDMKTFLTSTASPDGMYYISTKNSHTGRDILKLPILKGKLEQLKDNNPVHTHQTIIKEVQAPVDKSENVLSYGAVLNLQTENVRLELELKAALEKVEEKEAVIEGLEADIEEITEDMEQTLSESVPSNTENYLKSLAEMIVPVSDRYFEQRDKQITLDTAKFMASQGKLQNQRKPRLLAPPETLNENGEYDFEYEPPQLSDPITDQEAKAYQFWLQTYKDVDPARFNQFVIDSKNG